MKKIMILNEKHVKWYYDASTKEMLFDACLYTVKRRNQDGIYQWYNEEVQEPKTLITDCKEDYIKVVVEAQWEKYEDYLKCEQRIKHEKNLLQKAIDKDSGYYAYRLMEMRQDNWYEGYDIERIEDPHSPT